MKKVHYKKSIKKIYVIIVADIFVIFTILFLPAAKGVKLPYPDLVIYLQVTLLILLGITSIYSIRKAKNAKCPNCDSDLYNIIDLAKNQKIPVNHCISCGERIEI